MATNRKETLRKRKRFFNHHHMHRLVPRLLPGNPLNCRLLPAENILAISNSGGMSLRAVRSQAGAWERIFLCLSNVLLSVATLLLVAFQSIDGLGVESYKPPQVLAQGWQIDLVASEPDLVTPVSCRLDSQGRLLVVECHTHFTPKEYEGPKTDRVYLFDQFSTSEQNPLKARKRLFYEGGQATMGLATLPDGWIVIATRSEVCRVRDSDGDDVADQHEVLLRLETAAEYPHNGLAGLAVGPDEKLYIGLGENFGEPYQLVATDGSTQKGGGEGGNLFRCSVDGKGVERVATGFWNPFGISFDRAGRMWVVENDPDAMPPCRLLHVVPGGDYGFQFRFGRAGTHPLQSWNGEFPGTLPMACGTGEAPCAVVEHENSLWVTSWGSNRIERHERQARGASWTTKPSVAVQGDAFFRPVDMAVAPDGSIFITDWVDRSYPVHGKGRLWRLSRRQAHGSAVDQQKQRDAASPMTGLTSEEKRSEQLRSDAQLSIQDRLKALSEIDPFISQSALFGLVTSGQLLSVTWEQAVTSQQQIGLLTAWRWKELSNPEDVTVEQRYAWIERGLHAESAETKLAALRWATERNCQEFLPAIREILTQSPLTPRLFSAVVASIAYLETGSAAKGVRDPEREKLLLEFAEDTTKATSLRALAVQMLPSEANKPTDETLGQWLLESTDRELGGEIVRLLNARATPASMKQLANIAVIESVPEQVRADAIAGLVKNAGEFASVINQASLPKQPEALRNEAQRVLHRGWSTSKVAKPQRQNVDEWEKLLGDGGDYDAGRRVFFRTTCANCHAHSGRGSRVGPDLTQLYGQSNRRRILESILMPSREVGPLFVQWRVLTVDGQVLTGMRMDKAGKNNSVQFLGAEGGVFEVPLADIETQSPMPQSIMPEGLEEAMSIEELRDLMAFLEAKRP